MIETLYKKMMIPESCRLGKRVYKKLFHENAELGTTDKRALQDDVENILWQYTFKPTTIPIQSYEDDHREYQEVALLQVNLKKENRVSRLCEMIHRAIPYPLILAFCFSNEQSNLSHQKCLISLANKRFSHSEKEAIVVEDFEATAWLDLSNPTENQTLFLETLNVSTWPHTHFFAFYKAIMDRVVALACAEYTGRYTLETPKGLSVEKRSNLVQQIEQLAQEINETKGKLKGEKNLGTQVQLNTQIKQIKDRIEKTKSQL